jgi:hypothetical protein
VSHARVQSRQKGRIALLFRRRVFPISIALGLALAAGGVPTATANPGASHEKVFVCKYVGQPKVDERLQTGNNPIDVDTSSIKPFEGVGSYFADAQGQSFVLKWADKGEQDPPITDCPAPRGPDTVVTTSVAHDTTCTAFTTTTTTTTTTYTLKDGEWVGDTVVTIGEPVITTPTDQQIEDAGLDCTEEPPAQPDPVVTTESAHDTTCKAFTTTTTTTTTAYVLKEGEWVLGTPVVTIGEPVITTPTAQQIAAADLTATCATPVAVLGVSATATPKATTPAKATTSAVATLPAAAHAGEADTNGQLAAGELTGFAAFLAFGAAFMLRRRRVIA